LPRMAAWMAVAAFSLRNARSILHTQKIELIQYTIF
jgi:hypothetical protein